MRKIAIIGLSDTTHHRAPWGVPTWERWALAWDTRAEEVERYFEPHIAELWDHYPWQPAAGEHADFLRQLTVPIYMEEAYEGIPYAVRYPIEDVNETLGIKRLGARQGASPYLESSIGYMLALALHEAVTLKNISRIGVWGVDMTMGEEYHVQRPNAEYLIGRLHGAGVPVFIPPESALLKSQYSEGRYGFQMPEQKKAA